MITVTIRKQGASAIMTIPSDALKILGAKIGDVLVLDIEPGRLTAQPVQTRGRKRYKLSELLEGVTQEKVDALISETNWAQEGGPSGREIG